MNITGLPVATAFTPKTPRKSTVNFGKAEPPAQQDQGITLSKAARLSAAAMLMLTGMPAAKAAAYELRGVTRNEIVTTLKQASTSAVITEQALPDGINASEIQRILAPYQEAGLKATVIFADPRKVFRDYPVVINRFNEEGKFILLKPRVQDDARLAAYARRLAATNPEAGNSDVLIVLTQIPRLYSEFQTPENQIPLDKWQQMSPEEQLSYFQALRYQYTYVDLTLMGTIIPNENAASRLQGSPEAIRDQFNATTKSIGPRSASVRDSVERLAELIKPNK